MKMMKDSHSAMYLHSLAEPPYPMKLINSNCRFIQSYNAQVSYENLAPSERSDAFLYATDENGNPYAPAWWTLDFKGSYAFNEKLLLTFGVENILNYRYRPYSSGITSPGRNFIVAFRYTF